jgi:hypothetical protein
MQNVFWRNTFLLISLPFLLITHGNTQEANVDEGPLAKVKEARGDVRFRSSPLHAGQIVSGKGILQTGKASYVKIFVSKWGNDILLGPNTEMEIDLTATEKKVFYTLAKGLCRWINLFHSKDGKPKGAVHTKQASLGVRGTDFLLVSNPILGETEIVMFDGKVEFASKTDTQDKVEITKGQWGGLGGRFGQKITTPMNLPAEVIEHFKGQLQ